ncbi:SLAP domain-containing protein [Companilactobacillus jidongensis]|uniref:SLAP domain-containing protein n=1 Tax=Companilactobacillus jidongensis TaxID=2486006 RepID=UPI000F788811|nr:SLAP domain-containing protein [Companilactobacillus jidongensis]
MRKSTMGSLVIAGFAAVSIGAFSNMTNVSAAGVTTTRSSIVRIYSPNGNLVKNRALGPNTAWRVGKTKVINGEKMYQVATTEYVKASETDYDGPASSVVTKDDFKGTWIGSQSVLGISKNPSQIYFNAGGVSVGDTEPANYSIVSINGNQITITYSYLWEAKTGIETYTLTGNKLESNSTHEVWYKQAN